MIAILKTLTEEQVREKCNKNGIKYISGYTKTENEALFKCPVCNRDFLANSRNIIFGAQKTCGNCGVYRNGVKTSQLALNIHHSIDPLEEFSIHNYKTENCGNVDIFIPELNLIIEIDGAYWHKDNEEKDNNKRKRILENGYKLLTIKIGRLIPDKEIVDKYIFDTIFYKEKMLVMPDWEKCMSFEEKRQKYSKRCILEQDQDN